MEYFVYYKDGVELLSFFEWVNQNGTSDDKKVHDADTGVTEAFELLLVKYLKDTGATHVRKFNSDGTPVEELQAVEP